MDHIIALFTNNFELASTSLAVIHLAGFFFGFKALLYTRTPQGAIAWGLGLIILPYISIPLYLVLGPQKVENYRSTLEAAEKIYLANISKVIHNNNNCQNTNECLSHASATLLQRIAQCQISTGNDVKLLIDGQATFDALFAHIATAQKYILLQYYIVRDDRIGHQLAELLAKRVQEGVSIFLLFDSIGSFYLSNRFVRKLKKAGIKVASFSSAKGPWQRFRINFRNHRKIAVIDGEVAFVGGHNIGDEYLATTTGALWRDTHLSVQGPATIDIQKQFAGDWYWATGEIPEISWQVSPSKGANIAVLPISFGPTSTLDTGEILFQQAIDSATKQLWISTPYFVPSEAISASLQMAALRGVDVRLILPRQADHMLVELASLSFLPSLLNAGVKIFRYSTGILHQKVVLVDNQWSMIGSANLDMRSLFLNFEIMVAVLNTNFAAQVETMLKNDLNTSQQLHSLQLSTFRAVAAQLARLLAPIL